MSREPAPRGAEEDLDLVFNLLVNKEQRIPKGVDHQRAADPASSGA
jgi:hypothetical protein